MKTNRIIILLTVLLALFVIKELFFYFYPSSYVSQGIIQTPIRSYNKGTDKLLEVMDLIQSSYVDPVKTDTILESLMPKIFSSLDPHSSYIPKRDLTAVNDQLSSDFEGIGVVFNMATDTVVVMNLVHDGPSEKVGIMRGDKIIKVDDSLIAGRKLNTDSVMKHLRGKKGTTVKLSVSRGGEQGLITFNVERDVIPFKSVDVAYMIEPTVGFIKFSRFAKNTAEEFFVELEKLIKSGATRLIVDLRNNGGGFLDQAAMIVNQFLDKGDIIVYTEGLHRKKDIIPSDGTGVFKGFPLVILIDEESASASEILAGAIQDNDRGVIVGRRSFGKGLVQEQIDLSDGSAVRLTTSKYYTPSGRCIQRPYDKGTEQYYADYLERYTKKDNKTPDSTLLQDSLKYSTKAGRTVYGGGGIMPDVFVPLDNKGINTFFKTLYVKNYIFLFSNLFITQHREALNSVRSIEDMDKLFASTDIFAKFLSYLKTNKVVYKETELTESRALIYAQLRAYVSRQTDLDDIAFFHYINSIDNEVARSIEEVLKIK